MNLDCYDVAVLAVAGVLAIVALIHGVRQIRESIGIMRCEKKLHDKKREWE